MDEERIELPIKVTPMCLAQIETRQGAKIEFSQGCIADPRRYVITPKKPSATPTP